MYFSLRGSLARVVLAALLTSVGCATGPFPYVAPVDGPLAQLTFVNSSSGRHVLAYIHEDATRCERRRMIRTGKHIGQSYQLYYKYEVIEPWQETTVSIPATGDVAVSMGFESIGGSIFAAMARCVRILSFSPQPGESYVLTYTNPPGFKKDCDVTLDRMIVNEEKQVLRVPEDSFRLREEGGGDSFQTDNSPWCLPLE